jgi:hypothetical protein
MNLNGNTITIFGQSLTAYQAANPFELVAWYDGTTWSVTIEQTEVPTTGIPNDRLASMPAMTFKMNSGNLPGTPQDVTSQHVATLLNVENDHIWLIANFNSGAISPGSYRQDILIPYKGECTKIFGYVMQQIAGVDDGNVSFGIASSAGGGVSSFYELTVPAHTAANSVFTINQVDFDPGFDFNANYYLSVETTKSIWGGQVMFTVVTKRTV